MTSKFSEKGKIIEEDFKIVTGIIAQFNPNNFTTIETEESPI